jgi:serine/threonine protein kinase/Tol biopolymer transport system component
MTPERWQQVKAIFNSALEYLPEERDSFLSQACSGDTNLRSEVESLIASHEQSGEFIDDAAYQKATWLADERTELRPGQQIGSYQVLSFISRGGMGEVYLAQDQRLSRKVALKILPSSFTKDIDRLRRFEQEARSASALNHPNIITIYEIQQLGETHVIVTEFVEGETLRERLRRAPLYLSEALNVSIQVSDALSAAHKAGIIHRDIKPENVMLRPDGYVKVLDFGLAKLSEQLTSSVAAEAPTIQVRTGSGIVIGTAGYMSPEQARGVTVDARSDIFSLGAMIYETVARRKPFEGETPSDTLASILKTEPPSLSILMPGLPAELNRIVSKSLRKDREERYQVVKDLWLDLKSLKQELEFQEKLERSIVPDVVDTAAPGDFTSSIPLAQTTEPRSAITSISESISIEIKRHKLGAVVALLSVVAVVALAAFGIYRYVNRTPPLEHFWDIKLSRITSSGDVIDAAVSPDGTYVVYARSDRSTQSLYIRQVSTANDKLIVPPAPVGVFGMTFSPNGADLYYVIKSQGDPGTLYRVPVLGGTPVKILQGADGPISFAPDGKRFVLVRGNYPHTGETALVISNLDGSEQRDVVVKKLPERLTPIFFTGPSWSPDGKLVTAAVLTVGGTTKVVSFSVADGTEHQLTDQTWGYAARTQWLPDMSGVLVVAGDGARDSQLWFVSYPQGKARRVTNDLNAYRAIGLTADGKKFTTVQSEGLVNLYVVPNGDSEKAVRLPTGNVGFYGAAGNNVAWLPDGRIVLSTNEGGEQDIWVMDTNGTNRKQLTANGAQNVSPVTSPDGKYVVFASLRDGVKSIWRIDSDGNNPVRLTNGGTDSFPSFTPDGKEVVYTSLSGAYPTLWKVSLAGGAPQKITDHPGIAGRVSPDGKQLMFMFSESPDPFAPPNRLAIIPFGSDGQLQEFPIATSGTTPTVAQWARDGKAIIFSENRVNVSNLWSQSIEGGAPKQLTDFKDSLITGFAWSFDGTQLACTRGVLRRDAVLVTDTK